MTPRTKAGDGVRPPFSRPRHPMGRKLVIAYTANTATYAPRGPEMCGGLKSGVFNADDV